MGFNIKYADVDGMYTDTYSFLQNTISTQLADIDTAVQELYGLSDFQGPGAESIKSYFNETHGSLVSTVNQLGMQLLTDYAKEYLPGFGASPINENNCNAVLPEDAIGEASKTMSGDSGVAEKIIGIIDQAEAAVPSGCSFDFNTSRGKASGLKNECNLESLDLSNLKTAIAQLEDDAADTFSNGSGEFQTLLNAFFSTIAACENSKGDLANYASGTFAGFAAQYGLQDAWRNSLGDCQAHSSEVSMATEGCLDRDQERLEIEQKEAEDKKMFWTVVGTVAAVVVLAAAVVATVCTAGTASCTLLFAAKMVTSVVGLGLAAADFTDRASQLGGMTLGGDKSLDRGSVLDSDGKAVLKKLNTAEKDTIKLDKYEEDVDELSHKVGRHSAADKNEIKGDEKDIIMMTVDLVEGQVVDKLEDSGHEGTATAVDSTYEIASEAVDQVIDSKLDPAGYVEDGVKNGASAVGALGKATEVVADYKAEQYDKKIDECQEKLDNIKDLRTAGSQHQFANVA